MAQGWFTEIDSMIKWIRTIRLPIKNSLSCDTARVHVCVCERESAKKTAPSFSEPEHISCETMVGPVRVCHQQASNPTRIAGYEGMFGSESPKICDFVRRKHPMSLR